MKKFGLLVVAGVALMAAASAQAALISLWDFDGTATNAVTGATGSVGGTSTIAGTGKIGSGSLGLPGGVGNSFDAQASNLPAPETYGTNANGFWTGTMSFWVQGSATATGNFWSSKMNNAAGGGMYIYPIGVNKLNWIVKTSNSSSSTPPAMWARDWTTNTFLDDGWHHIVASWNLTTGNSGTGSVTMYVDGNAVTNTLYRDSCSSDLAWPTALTGSRIGGDNLVTGGTTFTGGMDDVAVWNENLAPTQVNALMNLGNNALNYNAKQLQGLFDIYTGTSSADATVMAGLGWSKYGTGTAFNGTGAYASNQLALGTAGGVQFGITPTRLIVNGGTVTRPSTDAQVMPPGPGADIQAGMLVLDYSGQSDPAATVKSLLTTAYNNGVGSFTTGQFISTTGDAIRGLGWIDNTTTSKISIARTVYGDVDLNGTVGLSDLGKVLTNWGVGNKWGDGDVDYNSAVGLSDLGKVLTNWGLSVGSLTPAGVPEPSSLALLAILAGLAGAWAVRRRT